VFLAHLARRRFGLRSRVQQGFPNCVAYRAGRRIRIRVRVPLEQLRYRDDEFYVADMWNGDEERSVRTLSGGETFLASLALALSLSGQVRALSSVDYARLDSLFLDEGFASLDREAVDLVIDGLERLGADGRIVGVITHLREITTSSHGLR
jgi:DNA repair exonuclease SbcCD ATPase subunit